MGCERWNERDRDWRGPPETQRQGQMEMRETSGQTDREVDTALQGDRGRYRVKGGERNVDHISSTKDGWKLGERQRDPERQGHREQRQTETSERQTQAPSLWRPQAEERVWGSPAHSRPTPPSASWLLSGANSPDSSVGYGGCPHPIDCVPTSLKPLPLASTRVVV